MQWPIDLADTRAIEREKRGEQAYNQRLEGMKWDEITHTIQEAKYYAIKNNKQWPIPHPNNKNKWKTRSI